MWANPLVHDAIHIWITRRLTLNALSGQSTLNKYAYIYITVNGYIRSITCILQFHSLHMNGIMHEWANTH